MDEDVEGVTGRGFPDHRSFLRSRETFERCFPAIRPTLRLLGVDTRDPDTAFKQLQELPYSTGVSPADLYSAHFAERGWILFDGTSSDLMQEVEQLVEAGLLEEAEQILVGHTEIQEIERRVKRLRHSSVFASVLPVAQQALREHQEGRPEATVPLLLTAADSIVKQACRAPDSESNGAEDERIHHEAWNEFAQHSKGLYRLKQIALHVRRKRGWDPTSPAPGLLTGLDEEESAELAVAKAWTAFLSVTEWAKQVHDQASAPSQPCR